MKQRYETQKYLNDNCMKMFVNQKNIRYTMEVFSLGGERSETGEGLHLYNYNWPRLIGSNDRSPGGPITITLSQSKCSQIVSLEYFSQGSSFSQLVYQLKGFQVSFSFLQILAGQNHRIFKK